MYSMPIVPLSRETHSTRSISAQAIVSRRCLKLNGELQEKLMGIRAPVQRKVPPVTPAEETTVGGVKATPTPISVAMPAGARTMA